MKRILTIQDISCVGKCSLTVALPIISAFGVETCVLPTAVLSTHTAFSGFTFRDLTSDVKPIVKHWIEQKIGFDAIYTGYLGSLEQIEICKGIFTDFKKENNFILVDPVMGDNGTLYKGFTQEFADNMAKLCGQADIIVPNLTEASFMLHTPYVEKGYDEKYIQNLLIKLTDFGCKTAILTGVSFDDINLGIYGYDSINKKFFSYFSEQVPKKFHGTGDVFASTLCGALTVGKTLSDSAKLTVDYTVQCIKETIKNKEHNWYGVDFETCLPFLIKNI